MSDVISVDLLRALQPLEGDKGHTRGQRDGLLLLLQLLQGQSLLFRPVEGQGIDSLRTPTAASGTPVAKVRN